MIIIIVIIKVTFVFNPIMLMRHVVAFQFEMPYIRSVACVPVIKSNGSINHDVCITRETIYRYVYIIDKYISIQCTYTHAHLIDLTPISVRCVGRVGICPPAMITTSGTTSTTSCSTEKYSQLKIKFRIFIKYHKTVWIGGFLI